ncbi:MAG TPA: cation:proton antiporter [Gemmataceae bacterium]|nr:cation:proton antiporter [Gemmataceae bacterium]
MPALDVHSFLGLLVLLLGAAKLCGTLAQWLGQPAVLGELLAGVLLGASVFGLIDPGNPNDPRNPVLHVFEEIGVVLLLFEIGMETDLKKLLRVGGASTVVAVVGVVVPFVLGYTACWLVGVGKLPSIVAGAALTATSVGITARVLSDLKLLHSSEGQIILGAAVLDDVLGLVILTVVAGLTDGKPVTLAGVAWTVSVAFGFLTITLVLGRMLVPPLFGLLHRGRLPGAAILLAVMLALGLSWLAHAVGSEVIIGSFAAGLLLSATQRTMEIEHGIRNLAHFFVPIFFLMVGAAVDVRALDSRTLGIAALLIVAAVIGKFVAGYAPFWFRGRKNLIGVGMIPRGEVGLIFAQMGLEKLKNKGFDVKLFSAVTLTVLATTLMAPPLLKWLAPLPPGEPTPPKPEGIAELTTEP